MFENVGKKLEGVAVAFCWIGVIASFIGAVVLWSQNSHWNPTIASGLGALIGGGLASWLGSLGCYAFGQMAEDLHALRNTSDESLLKPKYDEAMRQKAKQQYAKAGELFRTIEQYDDAAEQANACFYLLAEKQMEAGNYKEALQSFEALDNLSYRGAYEQMQECWYKVGIVELAQEKYDEAQEAFLNADDYPNADEMLMEVGYQIANDFLKAGEIECAYNVFIEIENYKDVRNILESNPELQGMRQKKKTEEN